MKNLKTSVFSVVLALIFVFIGCMPATSFAYDESDEFSGMLRFAEFTLKTNAPTRTYAVIKYGSSTVVTLAWADSNILKTDTEHTVRIEADARSESLADGNKAFVSVWVDGTIVKTAYSSIPSGDLSLQLSAYKTPTVTISSPQYGCINENGEEVVWFDEFQKSDSGNSEQISFSGDEIFDDSDALFKITRDENNDGSSFVNKYDGSKLTYHGKDSANNQNSSILFSFGELVDSGESSEPEIPVEPDNPGDVDQPDEPPASDDDIFGGMLRFAQFNISTNAPTRTYAVVFYGKTVVTTLAWADDSILKSNTEHLIRIEADARPGVLSGNQKAYISVYVDGVLKYSAASENPSQSLDVHLSAYKTPTVTISNPGYGYVDENGDDVYWLKRFPRSESGSSEEIIFNGDEAHNGFSVIKHENNVGASSVIRYDGSKLTYHGKDSSTNQNSTMIFSFGIPESTDEPGSPEDSDDSGDGGNPTYSKYEEYLENLIEVNSNILDFEDIDEDSIKDSFGDRMIFADSGGTFLLKQNMSESGEVNNYITFDSAMVDTGAARIVVRNRNVYEILELSFDFMCDDFASDRKFNIKMNTGWISDNVTINMTGSVTGNGSGHGSTVKVKSGEWHNIKMLFDCNSDKFIFVADGEVIYDSDCETNYSNFDYMELLNGTGVMSFDNVCMKSYIARPKACAVASYDNKIEITMNAPIQTTERINGKLSHIDFAPLFEISENGNKVDIQCVDYNSSNQKFIITTKNTLVSSMEYTIVLSTGIYSTSGAAVSEGTKVKFTTGKSDFDITDIKISASSVNAKISNDTGEDKTITMGVVAKNNDGTYIFSGWTPTEVVTSSGVELSLDISTADFYEIVFADSNNSYIPVKNHIYGSGNVSASVLPGFGEDYMNAYFDAETNSVNISGNAGADSDNIVIINFTLSDGADAETLPFDDSYMPCLTTFARTGNGGSFKVNVKLPDEFECGVYRVYATSCSTFVSDKFCVTDKEKSEQLLAECNSEISATVLSEYLRENNNAECVGFEYEEISSYINRIADEVVTHKSHGKYTLSELVSLVRLTVARCQLESGVKADDVMREYSDVFGCTYNEYRALEYSIRNEFDNLTADKSVNPDEVSFSSLVLLSEIRASAELWSQLKDVIISNSEKLQIDIDKNSKYDSLTSSNKSQVFKNIKEDCKSVISLDDVSMLFEEEVNKLYKSGKNETSHGSSGGSTRGSGSVVMESGAVKVEPEISFTDIKGHFAENAIEFLSSKKVLNGYPDNSFKPDNTITRAEFAKLAVKTFDISSEITVNFDDVALDAWYYEPVGILASCAIVEGDGINFYPDDNITRQDAVVIINRILAIKGLSYNGDVLFDDKSDIADYAKDAVGAMAQAGVVIGNNNNFFPENNITRGESAIIVQRAFRLVTEVNE